MSQNESGETARQQFVFERVLNAPRELVFAAYTQPELLQHWWGPKDMPINVYHFDMRPGGSFRYGMKTPDGGESFGKLVYREIIAPEKLSFVTSFTDAEGNPTRHPLAANWPLEVLAEMTFTEEAGKTRIVSINTPLNANEEEHSLFESAFGGMTQGNNGMYDNFAAYLETLQNKA